MLNDWYNFANSLVSLQQSYIHTHKKKNPSCCIEINVSIMLNINVLSKMFSFNAKWYLYFLNVLSILKNINCYVSLNNIFK